MSSQNDSAADSAVDKLMKQLLHRQATFQDPLEEARFGVDLVYTPPGEDSFPIDLDFDDTLERLARRLGGSSTDDGTGFGARDITFEFFSFHRAKSFAEAAQKLGRDKRYKVETEVWDRLGEQA